MKADISRSLPALIKTDISMSQKNWDMRMPGVISSKNMIIPLCCGISSIVSIWKNTTAALMAI